MKLVRSVRDVIASLQEQHQSIRLTLSIVPEQAKCASTLATMKIKLKDCERTVNNGLEMSATTLIELEQLMEMERTHEII